MTEDALALLDKLKSKEGLTIIPATTSALHQFKRVEPFQDLPYAIVANGGTILIHGEKLPEWENKIRQIRKDRWQEYMFVEKLLKKYEEYYTQEVTLVDDIFYFTKLEDNKERQQELLDKLEKDFKYTRWAFTLQGLKLYIMPKEVSKENALTFLKNYLNENYVVTAGDGKLDKNFLDLGDRRFVPEQSEVLGYVSNVDNYELVSHGMIGVEEIFQKLLEC
jgi:hydroxymethylpyrimidine pyrophosphatase-like HAD family hydrolase